MNKYKTTHRVIDGVRKSIYVHHLVWIEANGPIPKGMEIDHINRDTHDNRLENLRLATRAQNAQNRIVINKHGARGVSWDPTRNKWVVQLNVNGKRVFMKRYNTFEEACNVAEAKRKELHGEFYIHSNER